MSPLAPIRKRRRPSLTPMIDVVFLLLVFFMLASRFGVDQVMPLSLAGGGAVYSGPPRLVEIGAQDLRLNGRPLAPEALAAALAPLMGAPGDTIVLRGTGEAALQDIVSVADRLRAAGYTALVLVE
ncbi:ExbD/TolR family protein [Antarcticimicrobium luteum]|uniref:Biopolymer transporter ExbD n=1 Tax=Antarcticimicrobium luteum TaxID=2547397 RepID=A0A4R5V064_9RHOB|nr:biopolymer transporter ExbD [Antarcticimicrobium luteum]TDK45064.1 biopolymer transporter ExbD [Antarcticimicrobium luteum]